MRKRVLASSVFWTLSAGLAVAQAQTVQTAQPATPAVTAAATRPSGATITAPSPWRESFDAFDAADRQRPPAPGGVVFVGSSSIRLWNDLEQTFAAAPVIKRGFGGSRMSDCADNVQRLVLAYAPRLVVVYAGDNDLADGGTPEQVLASFRAFTDGVRAALPAARVAYISIKPSPLRAALLPQIRQANALIAQFASATPGLAYIDIFTPMLDAAGQPRTDLYGADALHMNGQGYAVWKTALVQRLGADLVPPR